MIDIGSELLSSQELIVSHNARKWESRRRAAVNATLKLPPCAMGQQEYELLEDDERVRKLIQEGVLKLLV